MASIATAAQDERSSGSTLAISNLSGEAAAFVWAFLQASDDAILVTGRNRECLACNDAFSHLFGIPASDLQALRCDELRSKLARRLATPEPFARQFERSLREPGFQEISDMSLRDGPHEVILKLETSPVRDREGQVIGRIWRFRDVSAESRMTQMHRLLGEVNSLSDADSSRICREVLRRISEFYAGATVIISIRYGDYLRFKAVEGPFSAVKLARGNAMSDSYCQYVLGGLKPVVIQDARENLTYARLAPARFGFTRYMGVPLRDDVGGAVGTLCILDRKSGTSLTDDDINFMSLMAGRLNAELARERFTQERLAAKDAVLKRQQEDQESTQQVLEAMNAAFALLTDPRKSKDLVQKQTCLLAGLLGYSSVAILVRDHGAFSGFKVCGKRAKPSATSLSASDEPWIGDLLSRGHGPVVRRRETSALGSLLNAEHLVGFRFQGELALRGVLVFGRPDEPPLHDKRHSTLLEALVDQVELLIAAHRLQSDLVETNEELRQTGDRLVRSEKLSAVGTLAASAAHDIRNIVASLTILTSPGFQDTSDALAAVRENLDRFNVLAHRLLSYSKPERVERNQVDLCDSLARVLSLTAGQLRVSKVELGYVADSRPTVSADPHQLEHLFVNLILNAINAMVSGGALKIEVDVYRGAARVRLSDTGPGIPRQIAKSLFEPFNSTSSKGFGLGLYSCKRIVDDHGGSISARDNRPKGTTFVVTLPLAPDSTGGWRVRP